MRKKSLYLKVTALLLLTLLAFSPLTTFADPADNSDAGAGNTANTSGDTSTTAGSGESGSASDEEEEVDKATAAVYTEYASNENFVLSLSEDTYWIKILDKRSGKEWYSTPPGCTSDPIATLKPLRESVIAVMFTDKSDNELYAYSSVKSVAKDGLKVDKISSGVKMIFNFPEQKFTIPIQVVLTEDGFTVEILYNEIDNQSEFFKIKKIGLIPFFGAADSSTEGYLFLPDGSGALVDFQKATGIVNSDYREVVYGRDNAKMVKAITNFKENIKLPIFGIKNGASAFLAVIEQGSDTRAEIVARTNGSARGKIGGSSYNNVYSEFVYQDYDIVMAKAKNWGAKTFKINEQKTLTGERYQVSYHLLNGEKANYVGMAERYRQYLMGEQGMQKTATANYAPIYLNLIGALKRPMNVAGFPIDQIVPLTDYKDVVDIATQLQDKGINDIVINYKNWYNGSSEGLVPNKLYAENTLGGRDGFIKMNEQLAAKNVKLFANVDATDLSTSGNGIHRKNDAARSLDQQPTMISFYNRDTYQIQEWDQLKNTRFLLSPRRFVEVSENVVKYSKQEGFNFAGLADTGFSSKLYSDFYKDMVDRRQSGEYVRQSLKNYAGITGQLLSEAPNAYALPNATMLTSVPTQSSRFYAETDEIPFYQIVVQGIIPHSSVAVNYEGDSREMVLKALEGGGGIQFEWIAQNQTYLKDTIYDNMINNLYTAWIDDAAAIYQEINPILAQVSDQTIVNHELLQSKVNRTTYSNGMTITLNYNDFAVTVDGQTIEAQNYLVGR